MYNCIILCAYTGCKYTQQCSIAVIQVFYEQVRGDHGKERLWGIKMEKPWRGIRFKRENFFLTSDTRLLITQHYHVQTRNSNDNKDLRTGTILGILVGPSTPAVGESWVQKALSQSRASGWIRQGQRARGATAREESHHCPRCIWKAIKTDKKSFLLSACASSRSTSDLLELSRRKLLIILHRLLSFIHVFHLALLKQTSVCHQYSCGSYCHGWKEFSQCQHIQIKGKQIYICMNLKATIYINQLMDRAFSWLQQQIAVYLGKDYDALYQNMQWGLEIQARTQKPDQRPAFGHLPL